MLKLTVLIVGITLGLTSITQADKAFVAKSDLTVTWKAAVPPASKGYGLILRPKADADHAIPALNWRSPNPSEGFAVGINLYDPPTTNPFNADGNIENNPQREASLHLNGREIANRLSPVDLRSPTVVNAASSQPAATSQSATPSVRMRLAIHYVCGGADVTLSCEDRPIYDGYFVPNMMPQEVLPTFGGDAKVADVKTSWSGDVLSKPVAPIHVLAFDHVLTDGSHDKQFNTVDFPAVTDHVGRVIATLTLDKTPKGIDGWDRIGTVYVIGADGKKIELLRYITPYRKAWQWKLDVTDMLPLLQGRQKLEVYCGTYGPGWLVSLDFEFFTGDLALRPFKVTSLWDVKTILLGQAKHPIEGQLVPQQLVIDPSAKRFKLRTIVTGHGMDPNALGAGEFCPLWRTVHVGEKSYSNLLWKTDNYLNPCRPQGGTWKYSRAGWGPGTMVQPWAFDITDAVHGGTPPTVVYDIQPYSNPHPAGFAANQVVTVQLIQYR